MKYATLLGLAILMASITAAAGAEVPAQYRGLWCEARDGTSYRCRKATDESSRLIRRDGFNITEEGDCRVYAVTPIAKGHRLRMRCTGTSDEPELVDVNLRLDARGRLHFDSTEAEATGWEYDWRRCMVGRNVGNYGFRFLSSYSPPYDIDFAISDLREPDFKVGSVRLGSASWVLDDGKLGSRAEVLPHLRQGNALVVYSTDGDSVLRWQIEEGDKVAKFLIDCPRYWESGLWERRHRKHR
jgi:hypothetical protein